jgi:protein-S-isoprenylcysteine O-methyltransferase Ste14
MQEFLWIIAAIWLAFLAWLFIPALVSRDTPQRYSNRYIGWVFIVAAPAIVIFTQLGRIYPGFLVSRFVPDTALVGVLSIFLSVLGLGFSAWSRHHLGRNWSSLVRIRQGHQLITTGPYRIVRNPMYAGMVLALSGAALAIGEMFVIPAFIIGIVSIWMKIKAEEDLLEEQFGGEYEQYRREVKALIMGIL